MARTTTSKSFIRIFVPGFALLSLLTSPTAATAAATTDPFIDAGIHSDSQQRGIIQQFGSMIQTHMHRGYSRTTNQRRLRPPKHASSHGSSSSGYLGCLDYSSSELSSKWIFKSQAPACSSSSSSGSGGSSSSSGSGGSSSSGSGSSGSGGSGSSSSGSGSSGSGSSGSDSSGSGGSDSEGGGDGADDGGSDSEGGGDDADDGGSDSEGGGDDADDGGEAADGGDGNVDDEGGDGGDGDVEYKNEYDDPIQNFNIEECDTYSGLWMWDLSLTCDNANSLENCDCTFAEELMDMELLSCSDASRCPASCGVCMTCMRLLGCMNDQQPQGGGTSSSKLNISMYLAAAALCVLLLAAAFILSRRRKDNGSLGEHLVGSAIPYEPKVFLAPADSPDSFRPPVQFDAATASTGSISDGELGDGAGIYLAPVNTGDDDEA